MALHAMLPDLLAESLPEYVAMAEHAINTPKLGRTSNSCYGYPAAVLLFSIADAIGSYCKDDDAFTVTIDGKSSRIGSGVRSFYVLNSRYYELALNGQQFDSLYKKFRGPLTHNAAMVPGVVLDTGRSASEPFELEPDEGVLVIYLTPFLTVTKTAVERFLKEHGPLVLSSGQWRDLARKGVAV